MISIVSSTARPLLWLDFYKHLGTNKVDFEVIFVGPNEPDFQLPSNMRFIKSPVKPAQCVEIGTRAANGDYLLVTADDLFFQDPHPLDTLLEDFLSYENDKLMLSSGYAWYSPTAPEGYVKLGPDFHKSPEIDGKHYILPVGFTIRRDYYRYLGGVDRRFIALYWDLDLCYRVIRDGGITALSRVTAVEVVVAGVLCLEYQGIDMNQTLHGLWGDDFIRKSPVEPFDDYNILTESQGPKGRWV